MSERVIDKLREELQREMYDRLKKRMPRVFKLYEAGKPFFVIGTHEPYAETVFELIKTQEVPKGTWTTEDETWCQWALNKGAVLRGEQPKPIVRSTEDLRMVVTTRTDLNMRKGKIAAQFGHAVLMSYVAQQNVEGNRLAPWIAGGQAKISVGIENLDALQVRIERAKQLGIWAEIVVDEGRTEFHGTPTITCCAFGPATAEELASITGDLKLL